MADVSHSFPARKPIAKRPRNVSSATKATPLRPTRVRPSSPREPLHLSSQHGQRAPTITPDQESDSDELAELEREKVAAQAGDKFEDENFAKFVDCLNRFVSRGRCSGSGNSANGMAVAALKATANQKLMVEIRESISIHAQNKVLHRVPDHLLAELLKTLVVRIRYVSGLCKVEDASDGTTAVVSESLLAAQCAIIILTIFSSPNIPKPVLLEEILDDTASFLCVANSKVVYPACDPIYRSTMVRGRRKSARGDDESVANDTGDNFDKKDGDWNDSKLNKKPVTKKIQSLISFSSTMFELLEKLVHRRQVSETVAFQVASVGIRSLRVTGVSGIHSRAVAFVATVYASHVSLRMSILSNLLDEIAYLPANRRQLRTYRVIGSDSTSIRASSAMALHIVQVLAARIGSFALRKDEPLAGDVEESGALLLTGFENANRFASTLVSRILSKMFQDRDAEYKTAVQALLDDIMTLYTVPEWPGADILLRNFSAYIVSKLQSPGKAKLNALARALAVEYLGALTHRMSTLFGPDLLENANESESALIHNSAASETQLDNRLRLLRFFQEDSTTNSVDENEPRALWEAMFVMEDFQLAKKAREQSAPMKNEKENMQEDDDSEVLQHVKIKLQERLEALSLGRNSVEISSRQDASSAAKNILAKMGLSRLFNAVLEAILLGLQDPTPTVRARAVRSLSHLAFDKPTIMMHLPTIFTVMEDSCRDISTLVRDAALDFLGGFLTLETGNVSLTRSANGEVSQTSLPENKTRSQIFLKVFAIVDKRLKDSATSVRKRAINIFRSLAVEILARRDSHHSEHSELEPELSVYHQEEIIVQICSSLVGRLDDPETTVRNVAERTIRYSLFAVDVGEACKCSDEEEYANRSTQRLIALFRRLPYGSQTNLLTRIINKPMLRNNRALISLTVRSTVDTLHEIEDRLANNSSTASNQRTKQHSMIEMQRAACTSILYGFCVLDPSLIAPHCTALAPHLTGLKPATDSDIVCARHILRLLECSIPHVSSLEPSFLEQTISDVEVIVCQVPTWHLEEPSVRCLCALALHSKTDEGRNLLINLANTFFTFIVEQLPSLQALGQGSRLATSNALERNARGALVRLSLLLRFGQFSEDFVNSVYECLEDVCTAMLESWTENSASSGSAILLRSSVRAMIHFLTRHRSFLPKGTKTIMQFASVSLKRMEMHGEKDKDSMDILHQVFMGLHEMLRNEEERNSKPREEEQSKSNNSQAVSDDVENRVPHLAAEEDAEAGYLAVCAQSLIPSLSDAAKCIDVHVRRCVANILGLLTRQGLVLPATIISPLFSLLIDDDGKSRDDALRVVAFIADRHSSMLASAALPAIQDCFNYTICRLQRMQTIDNPLQRIASSIVDSKTGLTLLSSMLCMLSFDYRRSILEGLLRKFDPRLTTVTKEKEPKRMSVETLLGGDNKELMDSEDDGMEEGSAQMELHGTSSVSAMSTLVLVAVTIARLDYSSGAAVGGVLKQSGGTAAADAKLKKGRDVITEMCGIATRIISNSGQAVLRVALQRLKVSGFEASEKSKIADHASRLCLLLHLKSHLRSLKTTAVQTNTEADQDMDKDNIQLVPEFSLDKLMLTSGALCNDHLLPLSTDSEWTKQIALFRKMMREDSIEDSDIQTRQSRRTGRKAKRSTKRSRKKLEPSTGRVKKSRRTKKDSTARRQLEFSEEEDDGSEYAPTAERRQS